MTKLAISLVLVAIVLPACKKAQDARPTPPAAAAAAAPAPAEAHIPPLDPKNIVSIAIGSKDHTTLVAALKAADYVTSIANPGPLTVFAPTNAAFGLLPKGTVEDLVKPENQAKLQEILKYHVTTSVYGVAELTDGMTLSMANGEKTKIQVKAGKISINAANVLASIRASNGIVHIIDAVLTPPPAK